METLAIVVVIILALGFIISLIDSNTGRPGRGR